MGEGRERELFVFLMCEQPSSTFEDPCIDQGLSGVL